jgi:hypothetical protein
MSNSRWNSSRLLFIFIASAILLFIVFLFLSTSITDSEAAQSSYPPIVASHPDEGIQSDHQEYSSFQFCGTYFLSLPEKCLIGNEYVSRTEFPDQRLPGIQDEK